MLRYWIQLIYILLCVEIINLMNYRYKLSIYSIRVNNNIASKKFSVSSKFTYYDVLKTFKRH